MAQRIRRERPAEIVSLQDVAVALGEESELLFGLDALGDDLEAEAMRHRDDRVRDREAARIGRDLAHERDVDLEAVDGEALQVREVREAGAEVVDAERDAGLLEALHERHALL